MKQKFYKYQGTGNSFILIDNRNKDFIYDEKIIRFLCDRNFGIGSDGLIILNEHQNFDFEMKFYNPDGSEATFCGNGGRCIVAFAKFLGIITNKTTFLAKDGVHEAYFEYERVVLKMIDVEEIRKINDVFYINTGTHHTVKFVADVDNVDIMQTAPKIRYSKEFEPHGTNVNFVENCKNYIKIRTYEKGVEQETLSCGTGVVAAALVHSFVENSTTNFVNVQADGGMLKVKFQRTEKGFKNIYLYGSATQVFEGQVDIS